MDVPRELEIIELEKGATGLGFNIVGGCEDFAICCDSQHIPGDSGIFITRIKPGGAAEVDGRLHIGDRIVSVNGENLIGLRHEDAVSLFRRTKGKVVLEVEKNAEKKLQENPNFLQRYENNSIKPEASTSSMSAAAGGNKSSSASISSQNAHPFNPMRILRTLDSTPPKASGGGSGDAMDRTPTPKSVSNATSMSSLIDDVPKTPKKPKKSGRGHRVPPYLMEAGYGIVGVIAVAAIAWLLYRRYANK